MQYRLARASDATLLAELNHELIQDEGHRNRMSLSELEERMTGWLRGDYEAVVFENQEKPVGYALFRREQTSVYLRQFYVCRDCRRQGIGQKAMAWLRQYAWQDANLIRLDVFCTNVIGIEFWRAVGFRDYCVTLELDQCESTP